jgi:protein O-mannosyl-transferase
MMPSPQALRTDLPAGAQASFASWAMLLAPALPALVVALVWWPALPASFQFDDWNVIVDNSRVHSLAAWWQSMPGIRPLLKLTYGMNASLALDPWGFRLVNVSIHAVNAMLVWWLLRERGLRAGLPALDAQRAALLAGLVFALHPVQTEAVTYISGRSSSLAACFCLLSAWCWTRSELSADARGFWLWLGACGATFLAAVASKETALVLPLALALYSADRPIRATLKRLAPLAALALIALIVALSLPTYRYLLGVSLDTRTIGENLLTQSRALAYLAGQLIRVLNGNADPQLPVVTTLDLTSCVLCLVWISAFAAALLNIRKRVVGAFSVLWFLIWLAPTNSLLPRLDVANDRQLYLALIGPAWWIGVRLSALCRTRPALGGITTMLMLLTLVCATSLRNRVYDTEVTFWKDTATRNPTSARAANNLGMAYAADCRLEEAASEFQRSIQLDPADFRANINLMLLRQGELPGAESARCDRSTH